MGHTIRQVVGDIISRMRVTQANFAGIEGGGAGVEGGGDAGLGDRDSLLLHHLRRVRGSTFMLDDFGFRVSSLGFGVGGLVLGGSVAKGGFGV